MVILHNMGKMTVVEIQVVGRVFCQVWVEAGQNQNASLL